jgi:hypothetical protein
MAIEPIVFSDDERTLIGTVVDQGGGWDSPDLDPIRSRIKQFYLAGQRYRCCYCQRENVVRHGRAWDVEHVISRAANAAFMFEPENLAVACLDCNLAKLDTDILVRPRVRFPRTADAYRIVHPHFDEWDDHFLFGGVVYTPLTAKGAETLKICKLYRFYEIVGKDVLFAHDRRYVELAEGVLFAKTPRAAEPAVLAMRALIQEAKDES